MDIPRRAVLAGSIASVAMSPAQRRIVMGSAGPSLALGFLTGALDPRLTFTRASSAWYFNSSGVLTSAATDAARFDYDPTTLSLRGLLIEGARTNSIRNNSMTGAVIGTPGTPPTNWGGGFLTGGTTQITSVAADSGIPALRTVLSGSPTAAATLFSFDTVAQGATTTGDVWTGSVYAKLNSGSLSTGFSAFDLAIREYNSGSTFLRQTLVTINTATSTMGRFSGTVTMGASTAFVQAGMRATATGAAVSADLTIGAPQLELSASATSPILTTTVAVTRAADVATMPFSPSSPTGTLIVQAMMPASGASSSGAFAQIDDGTANNTFALYSASGLIIKAIGASSGVTMIDAAAGTATAMTAFKAGLAFQAGSQIDALNGVSGTGAAGASYPVGLTTLRIGKALSASAYTNSWIQSVQFFPRALLGASLQMATT